MTDPSRRRRRIGARSPSGAVAAGGLAVLGLLLSACASGSAGLTTVPPKDRPSATEAATCARSRPATWMGCLVRADPAFGTLPLSGLAVPGADNAGAYNLDPDSFDTQTGSACSGFASHDVSLSGRLTAFYQTQNESITDQLDQGVRFVDLQVAYNGNGNPLTGWRVVQTQYSEFPLYDYLDQVANWADSHRSELVVVELGRVCYDNRPDRAVDEGLFANFASPSDTGGGIATLARVAFDPVTSGQPLATTSIDQVTSQGGGGHNVVVLLPGGLPDVRLLTSKYHVQPLLTTGAATTASSSTLVRVEFADASVTPTSASMTVAANTELASFPFATTPAMGSLTAKGLYETDLAYSFEPAEQTPLLESFGGLVDAASSSAPGKAAPALLPAWEAALWAPAQPGVLSRDAILGEWGHKANVVLADGVEYGGYVAAVIGLNAR